MERSHQKTLGRILLGCHVNCHMCLTCQQPGGHVAEPDWVQQATSAAVKGESTRGLQNGSVTGWRFEHGSRVASETCVRVERRVSGTGRVDTRVGKIRSTRGQQSTFSGHETGCGHGPGVHADRTVLIRSGKGRHQNGDRDLVAACPAVSGEEVECRMLGTS
ncbi:hypothetical protein PIB30_085040 [Stylosanthes scabra]|uniref:Uncharacterized protein n=1 Tax=Stylosanthes scabra TaxID=79078 RepID=A0ABU6ZS01_9FABA|nr:hypothetical protein [Stylosanthes scabra]